MLCQQACGFDSHLDHQARFKAEELRVSYSGYYVSLPSSRDGFDSRYPLQIKTQDFILCFYFCCVSLRESNRSEARREGTAEAGTSGRASLSIRGMLSADPGQVSRPQFRRPARAKFPLPAPYRGVYKFISPSVYKSLPILGGLLCL